MSIVDKVVAGTKSDKSKQAKDNLLKFVDKINIKLESFFEKELNNPFGVEESEKEVSKNILQHIKEHNLRPAKRLRASLVYYAYLLLDGEEIDQIIEASMSVELLHTALLIHDDFMDQDDTRRGEPTTHKVFEKYHKDNKYVGDPAHFGEAMATDIGDAALCLGFEILANSQFPADRKIKAINKLAKGITKTTYGQAFDITLEAKGIATEEDIINLHTAKTAIYTYENPLHVGAVLGGASEDDLKLLTDYAYPAGIAFQLQDDVLGLFGNPEKTGKPAHSDLRQGKMTLLIIKALENADNRQRESLKKLWGKRDLTDEEAEEARSIVTRTGSLEYSRKISRKWAKKAQGTIPKMEEQGWNRKAIDYLDGIAQYMVERDI